ncbi:MAG: sugar phosphate isomerase/epimerase [Microcystis aeruginosa DA14]|uniref:Sugar phosphate isomerase/epimerase n=1 Tax=Microcystis aeruginosa DA14 TaxID=1987506 RepID=A0A3E0MDD8_MICAE|nr:MAG: sugar phosphate isomerase/epimerase [Microcystis aeruginosa DA14]
MTLSNLPTLGAAIAHENLGLHRDWLIERQRDLELQAFFKPEALDGDFSDVIAATKKTLDGHTGRLGIHGPFWGFSIASHDPAVRRVVTDRFLTALAVCEKLRATQMVIHSPATTWGFNNLQVFPDEAAKLIERTHLTLGSVVKRAEDLGVTLVIENIEDKNPMDRVRLAESFSSPNVKVSLDTGHAHYAHVSTGGPPVDVHVIAAGNLLEHVHIQDADGFADRHWLPGEGTINWIAVFRALGRLTSNPRLVLEVRDQTNLQKGARHLVEMGLAV